jgi:hypothetical protein
MTESSSEKDNNKNNLLLAMLWLQRHREIMSLSQQNTDSTTASKVRFLFNEYIWGSDTALYYFESFRGRVDMAFGFLSRSTNWVDSDWT